MSQLLKVIEALNPGWCARVMYFFMSFPKRHADKSNETAILSEATPLQLKHQGKKIAGYRWGDSQHPKALMIHGWEGRSGNFGAIVKLLVASKYEVFAFDGPGHGKSQRNSSNMFTYAKFVNKQIQDINPKLIVSHSFGSIPTFMALTHQGDLALERFIAVTTPYAFKNYIDRSFQQLGLSEKTKHKLIGLIENKDQVKMEKMNLQEGIRELKTVPKTTIIHSQDDRILPITEAQKVARCLPEAELFELSGHGHYSILWSEETLDIIKKAVA